MHEEQQPDYVIDFDPELTELLFRHKELLQLQTASKKNLKDWDETVSKVLLENLQREINHVERIIKRIIADYQAGEYEQLQ